MYKRNIAVRSRRYCCRGKAISIADSECVSVALESQHTMRMHRIIVLPVASLALQYFSTFCHKRHNFRKQFIEHKIYFLIFSTNAPKAFLIVRRIIKVHRSSSTVSIILARF